MIRFGDFDFIFQSTPPVKAATAEGMKKASQQRISIHAAREGGDGRGACGVGAEGIFQSTPPVKAATGVQHFYPNVPVISIHAAREGGDIKRLPFVFRNSDFNPRRP